MDISAVSTRNFMAVTFLFLVILHCAIFLAACKSDVTNDNDVNADDLEIDDNGAVDIVSDDSNDSYDIDPVDVNDCYDYDVHWGNDIYSPASCVEDISYSVLRIDLLEMSGQYQVSNAALSTIPPDNDVYIQMLKDNIVDNACIPSIDLLPTTEPDIVDMDPFVWIYFSSSDWSAGAFFDKRTNALIFSMVGSWTSTERLCYPVLSTVINASYSPILDMPVCYAISSSYSCEPIDCGCNIDRNNYWGSNWQSLCGFCWSDRSLGMVNEYLSHTNLFNSMQSCGSFIMFTLALTTPGGSYCADTIYSDLLVIAIGKVDESLVH